MSLTQFVLLALERNMVSNKFGLELFYTAFKEAVEDVSTLTQEEAISMQKFFYAIKLLAKVIYAKDDQPYETMFNEMLMDRMNSGDGRSVGGRVP
jgi:hypothetical protein